MGSMDLISIKTFQGNLKYVTQHLLQSNNKFCQHFKLKHQYLGNNKQLRLSKHVYKNAVYDNRESAVVYIDQISS